jgi:hypothetical protein
MLLKQHTNDNSAFDVAFEVSRKDALGLIGFECKFTDTFSAKEYEKDEYRQIYRQSKIFAEEYETYISGRFNQLFRNQLIAESLLHHQEYDFVYTGLFCHQEDKQAIDIGIEFSGMLKTKNVFRVITYQEYIENLQQLPLDWGKREVLMLLWARYCATQFSENWLIEKGDSIG